MYVHYPGCICRGLCAVSVFIKPCTLTSAYSISFAHNGKGGSGDGDQNDLYHKGKERETAVAAKGWWAMEGGGESWLGYQFWGVSWRPCGPAAGEGRMPWKEGTAAEGQGRGHPAQRGGSTQGGSVDSIPPAPEGRPGRWAGMQFGEGVLTISIFSVKPTSRSRAKREERQVPEV